MMRSINSTRSFRNSGGYTAVEVMIAMAMFTVGAAGVMGMQRISTQANVDTRRADVANQILREWVERLRRDSMTWTNPNGSPNGLDDTKWLKSSVVTDSVAGDSGVDNTTWILPGGGVPGSSPLGISPAFDSLGRELTASETAMYCVQYRPEWLVSADGGASPLIRAEVRVYWSRAIDSSGAVTCVAGMPTGGDTKYHFAYAATTLRQNIPR